MAELFRYKFGPKLCALARAALLFGAFLCLAGCSDPLGDSEFFGKVQPPPGQTLRYISGSEPESLDPQIGSGQPEARIYMALFAGLVEYHPQTSLPIPDLAEKWDINHDSSEFTFHLRAGLRWSDGRPITAEDVVYSMRRGLSPELAARNAYLAYEIKYAQAFNEAAVFVRDAGSGRFLLENLSLEPKPAATNAVESLHQNIAGPARLVLPGDAEGREKLLGKDAKLKAACAGKEFVPVRGEDIGVQALNERSVRFTLRQSAPYFLGLMAHQFFRPVPKQAIEKYGEREWTRPGRIVCSGAFRLAEWRPYDVIIVRKNPNFWDAARVRLDEIQFVALEDITTMQNLYKAGAVDATFNHTVPAGWLEQIKKKKDYMDTPEIACEFYQVNITKAPMNDVRVRKALNMAIDKAALAKFRKTLRPLTGLVPEGIFPGYPLPKGDPFDVARAKKLLAEAGYADAGGNFDPALFPAGEVELNYNTAESNRQVAEFLQAQWKQNLGIAVGIKNMEFKTFLQVRARLEYKGLARSGWVGDYMDPYTFLALFSTEAGDNGTGWFDPRYVELLQRANQELDQHKRYKMLADAEAYLLKAQPIIPLGTTSTSWMKKPYVKGMFPNPQTLHAWKYVYIEHNPALWDRGIPSLNPEDARELLAGSL